MNSKFYYPLNAGSLGEPRRTRAWTSIDHRPSPHFDVRDAETPSSRTSNRTILVVEDDCDSLYVLKSILSTKAYFVLEASDGEEALMMAETNQLDLVMLDLQLPKLDGFAIVQHLRDNAKFDSLPIVMMTAYDPEEFRGTTIAAGCDDFL